MGLSIDREKVINGLEKLRKELGYGLPDRSNVVMEYLNSLTGALDLLKEYGWISVNDRLPNCNGCYLVWRPHFYPDKGMPSICYFDGQNTWHDSYGVDFTKILAPDDVSHWMPLPEQPCKAVKWE